MPQLRSPRYSGDETGAAAVEMALFLVILAPLLLNVIDVGFYLYKRTEVENAAQVAAQAAWSQCDTPPTAAQTLSGVCPGLTSVVTAAVKTTTLSDAVTWANVGSIDTDSGYRCPDGTNSVFTNATNSPSTCTSTTAKSGYYVKVSVSYPYRPMFQGATLAALFPSTITATSWMRIK
jgi:Flp pilus assembly protein TadG